MRLLGFLFVLVLIVAAVGYVRGWFSVTTTHAAGKGGVTFGVDSEKIADDAKAAGAQVGELSAKAVEGVKSMGSDTSEVEGTITAVDGRDLTLTTSSQKMALHVPSGVPILSNGESVGFEQLHPASRVKLSFKHAGEDRSLTRIEILR
jgi:hypothetical protein